MVSRLQTKTPFVRAVPPTATPASTYQSTSTLQTALASLNSRVYTNKITLLFIFHLLVAGTAIIFLCRKIVEVFIDLKSRNACWERRILRFWLLPIEGASLLSIILAFAWQIRSTSSLVLLRGHAVGRRPPYEMIHTS